MNCISVIWAFDRPKTIVPKTLSDTEGARITFSDFWSASKDVVRCELELERLESVENVVGNKCIKYLYH